MYNIKCCAISLYESLYLPILSIFISFAIYQSIFLPVYVYLCRLVIESLLCIFIYRKESNIYLSIHGYLPTNIHMYTFADWSRNHEPTPAEHPSGLSDQQRKPWGKPGAPIVAWIFLIVTDRLTNRQTVRPKDMRGHREVTLSKRRYDYTFRVFRKKKLLSDPVFFPLVMSNNNEIKSYDTLYMRG